jgi:hypothetical protein
VGTALMNDENNGMGSKATYLYNDFSYRNSNTYPFRMNTNKVIFEKNCFFISIYACDLVVVLVGGSHF